MTSDQQAKLDRLLNELSNLGYDCGLLGAANKSPFMSQADVEHLTSWDAAWQQSQAKKREILRFVEGLER